MAESKTATEPTAEPEQLAWSLRLPVALYVIWICTMFLIPFAAFLVSRAIRGDFASEPRIDGADPVLLALISLGSTFLAWLVVYQLIRFAFRPHDWFVILRSIGVKRPAPAWANAIAAPLGAAALLLALGLIDLLGAPEVPSPFEEMMKSPASAAALIFFALLIAPAVEEGFFRGLFFPPLVRFLGNPGAILASTALFALPHISSYVNQPVLIAGVAVLGLVAATLRAWTGSIVPAILAHVGFNGMTFILHYTIGESV